MKLARLSLCALLAFPLLRAEDTAKLAKIDELFRASQVQEMLLQQQAQIRTVLHQTLVQSAPTLEGSPFLEQLEQTTLGELNAATNWDTIKPDFVKVYAETFSEEEIEGLTRFYRSPLGQVLIEKQPVVVAKSGALMQERLRALLPGMQKRMQDLLASYQKQQTP